jgi:hypothetical protein
LIGRASVYVGVLLCAAELGLRADMERSVRTRRAVSADGSLTMITASP